MRAQIFRCEILLVSRVHPEVLGKDLSREQFDRVWAESVRLMGRAFALGSITTVFPDEAAAVGKPGLRRWCAAPLARAHSATPLATATRARRARRARRVTLRARRA